MPVKLKLSPRNSTNNSDAKNLRPGQPFASRLIVVFFLIILVVLISSVIVMRVRVDQMVDCTFLLYRASTILNVIIISMHVIFNNIP